jgi:putative transposase
MARGPRAEVAGGLYHIIARGNDRQVIFHTDEDHKKFLSLLGIKNKSLVFYLYECGC